MRSPRTSGAPTSAAAAASSRRCAAGAYALRTVDPGPGGSIHYAGTLPFTDREQPLAFEDRTGRLHGTERVYVADGSGFRYLPAKGLTFSVMANAHLVARHAAGRS